MQRYKAILFAPDGTWVTGYRGETKKKVIERIVNRGNHLIPYPFGGVILYEGKPTKSSQRLVDVAPNLHSSLVGESIRTVSEWLEDLSEDGLHDLAMGMGFRPQHLQRDL